MLYLLHVDPAAVQGQTRQSRGSAHLETSSDFPRHSAVSSGRNPSSSQLQGRRVQWWQPSPALLELQFLFLYRICGSLCYSVCVAAPLWFVARPCQRRETQRLGVWD